MSEVEETLQQLLQRRLLEMGKERGRDEPLTLKEAHDALPDELDGEKPATREAVRRVIVDGHTNVSGRTARTIATMFGLTEGEVLKAAGKRPPLGRFELPEEADRLEDRERRAVLAVVDAILRASGRPTSGVSVADAGAAPPGKAGGTDKVVASGAAPALGVGHQRKRRTRSSEQRHTHGRSSDEEQ